MSPGSRLLIVDRVIDEPVEVLSLFYDLYMLVQIGGRERTATGVSHLAPKRRLQMQRIIVPTESPMPLRLVEASL